MSHKNVLFDPSCLYGDVEFGNVLSEFEGGFHPDFFKTFRTHVPVYPGAEDRKRVYALFYYCIMWHHVDESNFKKNTLESVKSLATLLDKF
ncbi:hypothetical protein ScPMuIL_013667 [Solemya velum]